MSIDLAGLRQEIPFQWKIQSKSKDGKTGTFVAYIDARDVMNILDKTVGPENWQDTYQTVNGNLVCGLGIKTGTDWTFKFDVGTPSDYEAEKGSFSDAFKRAAVKWGIGRFLYDLDVEYLPLNENGKPINEKGQVIKDVTAYINARRAGKPQTEAVAVEATAEPVVKTVQEETHPCTNCGKPVKGSFKLCYTCNQAAKK